MVKRDTPNIQIKVRTLNETIYLCSAFFLLVFSHFVWNYVTKKKRAKLKKKFLVYIYILVIYFFFVCVIYCITIFFLCCCKVQYLVDILIKAKALVLNRNYISTHSHVSDVMQMKKKSYIKFYFSFIYNYLNWLSYIHTKKKKYIYNKSINKQALCFFFFFVT
jgi:hypothetical protein